MSPRFKKQWRPSLFKLMLMIQTLQLLSIKHLQAASRNHLMHSQSDKHSLLAAPPELDPMEPCYLSNNRASESLTISESTPVGTVVGEIMVNGDSSSNGNIELSIKMPGGSQTHLAAANVGTSYNHHNQLAQQVTSSSPSSASSIMSKRTLNTDLATNLAAQNKASATKHLNELIDLMPPLSIEQETKRLILAKKLDRENLDRYILAGGYQSHSSASLAQSSTSASLTVHVKCQLRQQQQVMVNISGDYSKKISSSNVTTITQPSSSKHHSSNSILIPIHLIVTDDNDNWPVFINAPYIIDLNESIPIGSPLPGNEIVAVDDDQQGPLSTIEYSIVPGSIWSDSFGFLNPLDARSLIVKDNRFLDYESQSKLTLKVMARDQGEPANWAIASLYINLFDTDDQGPVFGEDKYLGYVRDNRPGEQVDLVPTRLSAKDADRTLNAPIVYSFHMKTNHSVHFDLDPELGRLSLRKSLPDNQRQPFCLLIRATQADNPLRWTLASLNVRLASKPSLELQAPISSTSPSRLHHLLGGGPTVGVRVLDPGLAGSSDADVLSMGLPVGFTQANYTFEVSEVAPPGFTVIQAKSLLAPGSMSQHQQVAYYLLDDEYRYFSIDQKSGRLTLNKSLDYELQRHLSVRILVTGEENDGYLPRVVCDTTRLNVQVLPHNEFAPEFSHEQYNFQLSVSDLIANFDQQQGTNSDIKKREDTRKQPVKRYGASLVVPDETVELQRPDIVEQHYVSRSMLLGQVHCADRDFGDKVTLKLLGTKANLFHLTQDGRLYLPLVNISAYQADLSTGSRQRFFSHSQKIADQASVSIDRSYLNHLLAEFSNLGRLRLKAQASDDGPPSPRQTTALIVISIISIDNFILQRAPQTDDANAIKLSNETSYDTSRTSAADSERQQTSAASANSGPQTQTQVMMIPAANGRSFVQINPDIFSNLMSQSSPGERVVTTNSSQLAQSSKQAPGRAQPPSLLLVDDDGAKFVAMPAAIELYNQQVQEASEQQTRHRNHLHEQGSSNPTKEGSSLFALWKSHIGLSSAPPSSTLYWLNLSTALILHLVALALIISLVQSLRLALRGRLSRDGSNFWSSCSWPASLIRRASERNHRGNSVARSILDQAAASYASASAASGINARSVSSGASDTSDGSSGFGFVSSGCQGQKLTGSHFNRSTGKRSPSRRQQAVSCGVVVSAMSNGYQQQAKPLSPPSVECSNKQNLIGHLRVTLNKMLDANLDLDEQDEKHIGIIPGTLEPSAGDKSDAVEPQPAPSNTNNCRSTSTFLSPAMNQTQHRLTNSDLEASNNKASVSISVSSIQETQERKLVGSQSSSVASLVSMSSSISNKIAAAVERTQANTVSDVSSLDSTTLFSATNIDTDPSAKKQAPPPPPPPPPPPCLVQVGKQGPQVMSKPRQQNNSEQQVLKVEFVNKSPPSSQSSISKPFSSRPTVDSAASVNGITRTSPPQQLRRPLPQNPLHVKLRQQAAAMASQQQVGECKASRVKSSGGARGASSPKTVSPTTSVDRGYESFQSYTSSSQAKANMSQQSTNQQQQQLLGSSDSDLSQKSSSSTSGVHNSASSTSSSPPVSKAKLNRNLPPIPPGGSRNNTIRNGLTKTSGPVQRSNRGTGVASGILMEEPLLLAAKSQESFRVKRASQTLASGAQAANLLRGRLAAKQQAQQRIPGRPVMSSGGSVRSTSSSTSSHPSRMRSLNHKTGRQLAAQVLAASSSAGCGGDTEDEDFYYCYDQPATNNLSANTRQRGHKSSCKVPKDLLLMDEYTSHAYLQSKDSLQCCQEDSQMQQQGGLLLTTQAGCNDSDLMMMANITNQQVAELETCDTERQRMVRKTNKHNHHYHQHSSRHVSGHQSGRNSAAASCAAKKQLTWSDQVEIG